MECHCGVSSGCKQFSFKILLLYLCHVPTPSLHVAVSRVKPCCEREESVGLPPASLFLLLGGRCTDRVWCIWSAYGSSSLNSDRPFPSATFCMAIVGRESLRMLELMGWSHRQPRHLTLFPASLFFRCLMYFMRYILWGMRALVRLTSLLYLRLWIFLLQSCDV